MNETEPDFTTYVWTVEVEGGPAFMQNAIMALRIAAEDKREDSPSRGCLERLADACERAETGKRASDS